MGMGYQKRHGDDDDDAIPAYNDTDWDRITLTAQQIRAEVFDRKSSLLSFDWHARQEGGLRVSRSAPGELGWAVDLRHRTISAVVLSFRYRATLLCPDGDSGISAPN